MKPETLLEIGRITGPHGLKGEVRYVPYYEGSDLPLLGMSVVVVKPHQKELIVRSRRRGVRCVLLGFTGVDDRTAAECLRGSTVSVRKSDLPKPGKDEFYYFEVIGVTVKDHEGHLIGRVTDVFRTSTDVIVVSGPAGEFEIPVVEDFIAEIGPDGVVLENDAIRRL